MNVFLVRHRTFFALAVCAVIGVGVMTMAQLNGKGQVKSTQVSQRDIIEKLDGKDASATVRMVTIEPGQEDSAHRHTGPVFGYVLEDEYEHAMDEEPVKIYKAGETFQIILFKRIQKIVVDATYVTAIARERSTPGMAA